MPIGNPEIPERVNGISGVWVYVLTLLWILRKMIVFWRLLISKMQVKKLINYNNNKAINQ